jgi:hypothetical protein
VRDSLRVLTLFMVVGLAVAVMMAVIQADPPEDSQAFWRTRPIAPARMVAAKVTLLLALFVGAPFLVVLSGGWGQQLVLLHTWREHLVMLLVLGAAALSLMATASCTRTIGAGIALWVGVVFASGTVTDFVARYLPRLHLRPALHANQDRIISLLVFSVGVSLAILLNQYLRRSRVWSVALLAVGAIGPALIASLWTYYYFYRG